MYFNDENHIDEIINKKGYNNIIKIITINSLKEEYVFPKHKTFNYFKEKGVNKDSDPKSAISLLFYKIEYPRKSY